MGERIRLDYSKMQAVPSVEEEINKVRLELMDA